MKRCIDCDKRDSEKLFHGRRCIDCYYNHRNLIRNNWSKEKKEKANAYQRGRILKLKLDVLNAYSNNKLECKCCGEKELVFLTLDHINGGGTQHRKLAFGNNPRKLYRRLRQQNYPKGYQVLCFNCNNGKHINGGICPHQLAYKKLHLIA